MTTSSTPAQTGRLFLDDKDFVAVVDGDDNEVGAVPKHWDDSQLDPGTKKTNRKPKGAAMSPSRQQAPAADAAAVEKAVEDARQADAARIAELEKQLAEAKKGAGSSS